MARVKMPFGSPSVSGTLINATTSPPRGTRRRRWRKGKESKVRPGPARGPHAGPLIFGKDGRVWMPTRVWYDQKY